MSHDPTRHHDARAAEPHLGTTHASRALRAELVANADQGGGYHLLRLAPDHPVAAQPGHFAMIRAAAWGHAPLLPRPMSLLSGGDELALLIKVVGEGTRRMAAAARGERFALLAPLGTPWELPRPGEAPILVAGGVGLPPLLFLARELDPAESSGQPPVLMLYGGRTQADLPLAQQVAEVCEVRLTTEDGSRGTQGRVTCLLEPAIAERTAAGAKPHLYACGPHAMMAAVARIAASHQLPCDVSLESAMGCGYGVCLGCAVPRAGGGYLYTCTEGPCVDARQVAWTKEGDR